MTLLLVLSDHLILLRNGLFDEYQEIKSQSPDGTFDNARLAQNQAKVCICQSLSSGWVCREVRIGIV